MALLIGATLLFLMPVYVMVVNGLKDKAYMTLSDMWKLPLYLNGGGFPLAWKTLSPNSVGQFPHGHPGDDLVLVAGRYKWLSAFEMEISWLRRRSSRLILFGMFIPYQAILIPLIRMLDQIGIYGSWQGLVLVHVIYGIPITCLIFRNYFTNVPTELVEAARIDGAGLFADVLSDHAAFELAGVRGGRHLSIHEHLERFPLRRDCGVQSRGPTGDGGTQ